MDTTSVILIHLFISLTSKYLLISKNLQLFQISDKTKKDDLIKCLILTEYFIQLYFTHPFHYLEIYSYYIFQAINKPFHPIQRHDSQPSHNYDNNPRNQVREKHKTDQLDMFNNDHKIILFFRILAQIATSHSRLLQKDTTNKANAL